jgi:hypothetical protein
MRKIGALCVVGMLGLAAACETSNTGGSSDVADAQPIGPSGGRIVTNDVTLDVPPGALAADTRIVVTKVATEVSGYTAYSPLFRFEPEGLRFAVPATVTIAVNADAVLPVIYWSSDPGSARPYQALETHRTANAVSASVVHFSTGFAGQAEAVADAGPPGDSGAVLDAGDTGDTGDAGSDAAVGCGTLSGKVHAPNGILPIYNALVYVTKSKPPPLVSGPSCGSCAAPPADSYAAVTSTDGSFVVPGVPAGAGYSLVVEIAKWRRIVTLGSVSCGDNVLTDNLTRLPRNTTEGDIPAIAVATGGGDALECVLRRIGIDDAEFTSSGGAGRVHLYAGTGAATSFSAGGPLAAATTLWQSTDTLSAYDMVLLSCEGAINAQTKPPSSLQALSDYLALGGRVLATHLQNYWFSNGPPPLSSVATWTTQANPPNSSVAKVDTSSPSGTALASWLVAVNASTTAGSVSVVAPTHTVATVSASAHAMLTAPDPVNGDAVEYLTFDTPVGAAPANTCGRAAYSGLHAGPGDALGAPFPNGCSVSPLSNNDLLLAYELFDAVACTRP